MSGIAPRKTRDGPRPKHLRRAGREVGGKPVGARGRRAHARRSAGREAQAASGGPIARHRPCCTSPAGRARDEARTHGLGEVAVARGIVEVDLVRRVVGQDPRKHGVLIQIIVRAPRKRVEGHDVVKVAEVPAAQKSKEKRGERKAMRAGHAPRPKRRRVRPASPAVWLAERPRHAVPFRPRRFRVSHHPMAHWSHCCWSLRAMSILRSRSKNSTWGQCFPNAARNSRRSCGRGVGGWRGEERVSRVLSRRKRSGGKIRRPLPTDGGQWAPWRGRGRARWADVSRDRPHERRPFRGPRSAVRVDDAAVARDAPERSES